jgi:hypothetical protein
VKVLTDKKAVSAIVMIILIFCALVFGALISYIWAIGNYYNVTSKITVENVVFPVRNATYFNVTILDPSDSTSDANVTAIRLSVEGTSTVYNITTTEPALFTIRRGTRQTFECLQNWGSLAGETVDIEPVVANAPRVNSYPITLPNVKFSIAATFDPSKSVKYFNLTVEDSAQSVTNLTLSQIMLFGISLNENITPSLTPPQVLLPGISKTFGCNYNWESLIGENVTFTAETAEGYEADYVATKLPGALLYIDHIGFDYAHAKYFNVTVGSSSDSTSDATLSVVTLTFQNGTTIPLNTSLSPLPAFNLVSPNGSLTTTCFWPWSAHRNETVTVNVQTVEGFTSSETVTTPPEVIWNMTDVKFDLSDIGHFSMNVMNFPTSLQNVTIKNVAIVNGTRIIAINQTMPGLPFTVTINGTQTFNCTFAWGDFRGQDVSVTISTEGGLNFTTTEALPSVNLTLVGNNFVFGDLRDRTSQNVTIPLPDLYFNVTISNSINSLMNVTITKIVLETVNQTYTVSWNTTDLTYPQLGQSGYVLKMGETVTIMSYWDWTRFLTPGPVKVTVYTAEGFQATKTWQY